MHKCNSCLYCWDITQSVYGQNVNNDLIETAVNNGHNKRFLKTGR